MSKGIMTSNTNISYFFKPILKSFRHRFWISVGAPDPSFQFFVSLAPTHGNDFKNYPLNLEQQGLSANNLSFVFSSSRYLV